MQKSHLGCTDPDLADGPARRGGVLLKASFARAGFTYTSLNCFKSAEARRKKWGKKEFVRQMQEWGKLGGRPPKKSQKEKS
jgi:hypothetical protein